MFREQQILNAVRGLNWSRLTLQVFSIPLCGEIDKKPLRGRMFKRSLNSVKNSGFCNILFFFWFFYPKQTWAHGFQGSVDVSEVKEVYLELLKKGVQFPCTDTNTETKKVGVC